MPRWTHLSEAKCLGVAAISNGRIVECGNPDYNEIVFVLYITTLTIDNFVRFALPIIRNTNYSTLSTRLVGVQPMRLPTGILYYLLNRYQNSMPLSPLDCCNTIYDGVNCFAVDDRVVGDRQYLTSKARRIVQDAIIEFNK